MMNQSVLSQDLDNCICEAIDCKEKAIKTVKVNAGTFGQITLFLCTKCIDKFKNQTHVKNIDYQSNSQLKQICGDLS
jgi:hypothetical protein